MAILRLQREGGAEIELEAEHSLLGRDAGCEVVVDDKSVSRRHVLIERRGEEWAIRDQGSANGTYLDGRRVAEAVLKNGQQLRVGSVAFRVGIEEAAAPTVLMAAPDMDNATVLMAHPEIAPPAPARPSVVPPPVVPRPAPPAPVPPQAPPAAPVPSPAARPAAPRSTPLPASPAVSPAAGPSAEDPWQQIGLAPGATPEEIGARYEELSKDLQAKLAGARSASLKTTYEKNLVSLNKAYRQLSGSGEPFGDVADLPSAQPMVAADMIEGSGVRKRPEEEEIPLGEAAEAKGSSALLPPATSALVFLATGLLALIAFFGLSNSKTEKSVKKQEEAPEMVNARQAAARLAATESLVKGGAFRNGKLRLCNRSARPLEIDWLSTVSVLKTDIPSGADPDLAKRVSGFKLGTYNSGFCGSDFHVVLPPGSEQAVELRSQEGRCNFDGAAVFYALSLRRPAETPAPAEAAPAPAGRKRPAPAATPEPEKQPGEPGTTFWQAGLLGGGKDECVGVGAGW